MSNILEDNTGYNTPPEILQAFINLKYISGLPPGSKYTISNYSYSSWSPLQWFFRGLVHGESKEHTIDWITKIVSQSINLAKEYPVYSKRLIDSIREIISALNYLQVTYHAYPLICGKIQTLIENITYPRLENELNLHSNPINIPRKESTDEPVNTYDST